MIAGNANVRITDSRKAEKIKCIVKLIISVLVLATVLYAAISFIPDVLLLVKEGDTKPIIVNITDNGMELKINSALGSMNEEIDIQKQGKDLMIGFNPKFLIDALRVIDDEEVDLYMVNPKAPCFIKNVEESYIYLILPVNFTTVA